MAKLRVFVSSTYTDLKHIRSSLKEFIEEMGYEAVLFENGDVPFQQDQPLDISTYQEIPNCHMLILIVGGRYGTPASTEGRKIDYESITSKEYKEATENGVPVFIFVEKGVWFEYQTYRKNRKNKEIIYASVDDIKVFEFLDQIILLKTSYLKDFEKVDDITSWLKDQWAGIFAEFLHSKRTTTEIKGLSERITELAAITETLKSYSESIIKHVDPNSSQTIIDDQNKKLSYEKKLNSFTNHRLITFLTRYIQDKKFDSAKLLALLEKAKTFKEYLDLIPSIKEDVKLKILSIEAAQEDFKQIKREYSGE